MLDEHESRISSSTKNLIIIVIIIVIGFFVLRFSIFDTGAPFYLVSSGSMVPALNINDVLIVRNGDSFNNLNVGDVIVFDRPAGGDKVIVHRIAEIDIDTNSHDRIIRTKGDANVGSIPGTDYPITRSDYIGKVVFVIPRAGLLIGMLKPPFNYIIIAIIMILLALNLKRILLKPKRSLS